MKGIAQTQVGQQPGQTRPVMVAPGLVVGGGDTLIIAGPCSVESYEQTLSTAVAVKASGARMLRGGAYKPRTSPYAFQGLKDEGLQILARVRSEVGLPVITEVMDQRSVEAVARVADVLQVGSRNMHNYPLLQEVGRSGKPVLLKRGLSATIEEWLLAAEYILLEGNHRVILCERGIRTFETYTRNTLDLAAVVAAKLLGNLPVIVDPSHAAGRRELVPTLARAALACGADGLMVEVHPAPDQALSDGAQSLSIEQFKAMMADLRRLERALRPAPMRPAVGQ